MGRKRKEKVGVYDRLGETVNLEKCPECPEHSDCFSYLDGKCTALNVCGGQGCVFYKPAGIAVEESRVGYKRLRGACRNDLIEKYVKAYVTMGFLDEEIEMEEQKSKKLEDYRESDFTKLMTQIPGFDWAPREVV